jgi:hypothetical protein
VERRNDEWRSLSANEIQHNRERRYTHGLIAVGAKQPTTTALRTTQSLTKRLSKPESEFTTPRVRPTITGYTRRVQPLPPA